MRKYLDNWRPDLAIAEIYHFFWHRFCDHYLETTKQRKEDALPCLIYTLRDSLILLHPYMPYITEYLYSLLPLERKQKSIFFEKWPS